ncbi:helix-turn-helix domain-containing protein [Bradyrhizobium sp.]|uniref:MerR family transcriptional regulator n=1 Tax=Bradyrhizobium sp. TaxID=376 RepID=UPI0029C063EF|nr:helix-turn-helix domain-containing protein [Bradyrhizobium sp.]
MPIGTLSKLSGVHIETIRYYERVGVLPTAERSASGRRVYGEADVKKLAFVRHARELGFDLTSVRALLALQEHPERSCQAASQLANAQLVAVESRLRRLSVLRDELASMVRGCGKGRVADCRVMEALANAS